jgi:hypothetical protein
MYVNWNDAEDVIRQSRVDDWESKAIRYEYPHVDRLFMKYATPGSTAARLNLHVIRPCSDDALFHPHPWPSAMKILKGSYKMKVGDKECANPHRVVKEHGTITLVPGMYSMNDHRMWHSVQVAPGTAVYSIMVTGLPYEGETDYMNAQRNGTIATPGPQASLTQEAMSKQLTEFKLLLS